MKLYTIRYWIGNYSGRRSVKAETAEEAIAKMWRSMIGQTNLPIGPQRAEILTVEEVTE